MYFIGLSSDQLAQIAKAKDAVKVSRRDIAACLASVINRYIVVN